MPDDTFGPKPEQKPSQGPGRHSGTDAAAAAQPTVPFDWGQGDDEAAAPAGPGLPESYFTSDSDHRAPAAEAAVTPAAVTPGLGPIESPIDALFGETQFKDYEGEPPTVTPSAAAGGFRPPFMASSTLPTALPVPGPPTAAAGPHAGYHEPLSKNQRIMFWVAGSLLALLGLVLLFAIGAKVAPRIEPKPAAAISTSPSATPSPTPTVVPAGPAAVGVHEWSDLRGGECLDPFTTPFAEKFTVVDCAAAHPAQMVFRGTFPAVTPAATPAPLAGASDGGYPGLKALQAQINLLCTAPGVIDLARAGAYSDIQFQAAYAATAAEWKSGQHDYFCFVNRSGGAPITGSIAGTPAG